MINSWDDYLDVAFAENEDGTLGVNRDLRLEMTPKFRRIYDRTVRRIVNENTVYPYTRRYVEVTARKHRARRRRKRG
jgi:hypothetical protein